MAAVCALFATGLAPAAEPTTTRLTVEPTTVKLTGARARQQLLVTAHGADGYRYDATHAVAYEPADPAVIAVDAAGVVRPRRAGTTVLRVRGPGRSAEVPVTVADPDKAPPVSFANEVMAVLGRAGCNAGACHGHNSGKGGLKLSLRGYNPGADVQALTREQVGRRVDRVRPDASLILAKPSGLEHGGGKRFDRTSDLYAALRQWVAEGAKPDAGSPPSLERIEVLPGDSLMSRPGLTQQLAVRAQFADGSTRDVTDQAIYELSAEGVIEVDASGRVTGKREGEAAVLVRFLGRMGLARFLVIRHDPAFRWVEPPVNNDIDRHLWAKLKAIQVPPSGLSTDAEFLRRASLDLTGLPPTAAEARAFLADTRTDKRARKIDELIARDEFGEVWAAYWLELSGTTNSGDSAGRKGVWTLYFWLKDSVNRNVPYDRFVRELIAGKGSSLENPAVTYSANRLPRAEVVPQLFLGARLECAQCHDHPFDVWKQSDHQALTAFFADVTTKEGPGDIGGRELRRFVPPERSLPWERDRKVSLHLPDGRPVEVPATRDRREVLADWLFDAGKRQAARAIVNRVWGRLFGRGIVDPVDDMRFSNPPVNGPLLDALADDFIAGGYDFKRLVRAIANSRAYQLSSVPGAGNRADRMNFSHARLRRLSAEQLLDGIALVTGVDEKLLLAAPGVKAVQVPVPGTWNRFLTMFGRPAERMSPCECIRSQEASLPQVLHMLNGDTVAGKLGAEGGTLRRLLAAHRDDDGLVEELYFTVLSRPPTDRERRLGREYLGKSGTRQEGAEDLMWALLTSQEFLFNH